MTTKILNKSTYIAADPQIDENGDISYSFLTKDYNYIQSSKSVSRAIHFQSPEEAIKFIDDIPNMVRDNNIILDNTNIGMDYIEIYELQYKYIDTTEIRNKNMYELLNIGQAIEALKNGEKIARLSWNGKGMYIYLVPANKYPAQRNINSTVVSEFENDMVPYTAYVAMKTASGEVTPWNASQSDLLGDDWHIVN